MMANRLLSGLCALAILTGTMAGVATYGHSPYAAYHLPTAAATVYQSQPLAYNAASPYFARSTSPYFARSILDAAPATAFQSYTSPFLRTYAASPLAAISPVVKTYAAEPVSAVSPVVGTYAASSAAPVYANGAVVATPATAVLKSVAPAPAVLKSVEFDSSPRYDFSYGVHDSLTGDIKNQVESRNGGNVAGSYSVVDADGYKRTVTYTADDLNGFNAVVQREPIVGVAAAVSAPVAVPAAIATPVHHVQPIQQNFEYLPAQQEVQQGYLPQAPVIPVQPASEPIPVEYPGQQQYPLDQQYPPYPQFENPQQQGSNNIDNNGSDDDSDVVEVRSAADNAPSASSAKPAPITENQQDSISPKRTA